MFKICQRMKLAPWTADIKKIVLLSSAVVVPMLAFTITMLAVVFSHNLDLNACPNPGLCPYLDTPGPANSSYYYVDFPVGRLAFISSLSSTISFALVGVLMSMYGYVVASQIWHASVGPDGQALLPTPLGASTLIRLLNAEITLLWDMAVRSYDRFKQRKRTTVGKQMKESRVLRICRSVFVLSITASVLIQVTDTYFHVVTEAVSVPRLLLEPSTEHLLSRSLGPWVLDDVGGGNGSKHPYGAAIYIQDRDMQGMNMQVLQVTNRTTFKRVEQEIDSYSLNYTDAEGISYALIKPPAVDKDLDWTGTGFGVSTQCSPIPRNSCHISGNWTTGLWPFQCTISTMPGNITGTMTDAIEETWTYQWHQYMQETQAFSKTRLESTFWEDRDVANMTRGETDALFRNPWHSFVKISAATLDEQLSESFLQSPFIQKNPINNTIIMLVCNTTVYDTAYTVVNDRVTSLSAKKSNGTVAGIVSMPSLSSLGFLVSSRIRASQEIINYLTTFEAYIKSYELAISKRLTTPLVVHTIPAPAIITQRRKNTVITRLPRSALWLLVVANMLFAIFGCVLAILAIKATDPEVHQVHLRLSTAGLAAQLFDAPHAQQPANKDVELFRENSREVTFRPSKKVCLEPTVHGGAKFSTRDAGKGALVEANRETLPLRQTHTL